MQGKQNDKNKCKLGQNLPAGIFLDSELGLEFIMTD
jgi:hypothetical protein